MANSQTQDMSKIQTGTVESVDDPTFTGRIKVRVLGLHDNISTENLPWCNYCGTSLRNAISIPKVGDHVRLKFAQDDVNAMEWYSLNSVDDEFRYEVASDYTDMHTLVYDPSLDLSIKFQKESGLVLYYQGSFIQLKPDNSINIEMGTGGSEPSGVSIQLTDGKVYISAPQQINITSDNEINLNAKTVTINGEEAVRMKGGEPNNCAINAVQLITLLQTLATLIDGKLGASSAGIASSLVSASKENIMNQKITYL